MTSPSWPLPNFVSVPSSPRTPHLSSPTGHAHVGLQPPETLGRSPKTLPAPEVSGELVLSQGYHSGILMARDRNLTQIELHKKRDNFLFYHLTESPDAAEKISSAIRAQSFPLSGSSSPRWFPSQQMAAPAAKHSFHWFTHPRRSTVPPTYWQQSPRADSHLASLDHDLHPEPVTVAKLMECFHWPDWAHMPSHGSGSCVGSSI